ncbi:MAG: hypothetical protein ACM3SY_09045 [Candidatus Omnitrophota bacterium]
MTRNKTNKTKRALIIRSVSFQQLDKNIKGIVNQFPDYELDLLTHSHGVGNAQSYECVSAIIDYESRSNFSLFHIPRELREKSRHYDAIIVPVTNITGAGFLNVFLLSLRLRLGVGKHGASIVMCNLNSEIREIPGKKIILQSLQASFFSFLSALMTIPFVLVMLPVSLIRLVIHQMTKKQKTKIIKNNKKA